MFSQSGAYQSGARRCGGSLHSALRHVSSNVQTYFLLAISRPRRSVSVGAQSSNAILCIPTVPYRYVLRPQSDPTARTRPRLHDRSRPCCTELLRERGLSLVVHFANQMFRRSPEPLPGPAATIIHLPNG